jgi:hypothetical protein
MQLAVTVLLPANGTEVTDLFHMCTNVNCRYINANAAVDKRGHRWRTAIRIVFHDS